uniref:Uncharacterized protein n=1 Tax=Timema poppense TaxID=170557 RepID=A0A7R9HA68_TIMPO|nr:unnamed protein product [Timema poppensis]
MFGYPVDEVAGRESQSSFCSSSAGLQDVSFVLVSLATSFARVFGMPVALSSASLKPILWDGGREGERSGVASQPTKVSFRTNKNRWITETGNR